MNVLVINAGSSSLKYQLMDPATREVFAKGLCERIGIDGRLTHKVPGDRQEGGEGHPHAHPQGSHRGGHGHPGRPG